MWKQILLKIPFRYLKSLDNASHAGNASKVVTLYLVPHSGFYKTAPVGDKNELRDSALLTFRDRR